MDAIFEESEGIDEVEPTFKVIKAKRQKAVFKCDCSDKKIIVANTPRAGYAQGPKRQFHELALVWGLRSRW